jgi:F-type H+-transporting ATPase subunit delta
MASVTGVYARAFADVVVGKKLDAARLIQELHDFETLLHSSEALRRVLENPSIPGDQKRAVVDGIVARQSVSRQVRNFILVITAHRRLQLLSDILREVEQVVNERLGIADAEVLSARELGDSERRLLESEIARLTGKRVRARYERDSSLLGGAVVKVGSTIYDGSVKGQLARIREQLVESSS